VSATTDLLVVDIVSICLLSLVTLSELLQAVSNKINDI
jgi:hypothetical protein